LADRGHDANMSREPVFPSNGTAIFQSTGSEKLSEVPEVEPISPRTQEPVKPETQEPLPV